MEFEKEVKEIIEQHYNGNQDKFLNSLRMKAILYLLMSGLWMIISLYLYNTGFNPIILPILSIIMFVIGVFSHYLYNQCFKILNNEKEK